MERRPKLLVPPGSWQDLETHYLRALQHEWYRLLVALQDTFMTATAQFWSPRAVRFGHLPLTTGSVSSPAGLGSDSGPVQVTTFGVPTYLADSMQFGLEYLCRLSPAGAYYIMPSFRGETKDETHLSQFFHSEAEIPGGLDDVIAVVEDYVRHLARELLVRHRDAIAAAAGALDHLEPLVANERPFPRITFEQATEELAGDPRWVRSADGWRTLTRVGEQELMRRYGQFLWVTHWDELAVPFYQRNDGAGRALNADLLFGPGEVVGAGERHATGDDVVAALKSHGVDPEPYEWYVQMKAHTPLRTAGFGLGVERFFMWLLQQADIRHFEVLPRANGVDIVP